jgi:hypothetical protein
MNLKEHVEELKRDLLNKNGPQISAMGNFPFAILQYHPEDEYLMRQLVADLVNDLRHEGWAAKNISLFNLLIKRLKAIDEEEDILDDVFGDESLVDTFIEDEKRLYQKQGLDRSLKYLHEKLADEIEGHDGIAADIITEINEIIDQNTTKKTVVFLSRAGALFPFHKTSGLLKYLDGKTFNIPVILLYPGTRQGTTSLSFMGEYEADSDYRPRIYGS